MKSFGIVTKKRKKKERANGDEKRNAKPSEICVGDYVLAKRQIITNKLSTPFETTIYKVVSRTGSEAVIQSAETQAVYRRNVAHLKKLPSDVMSQPPDGSSNLPSLSVASQSPPADQACHHRRTT